MGPSLPEMIGRPVSGVMCILGMVQNSGVLHVDTIK